uniref:BED-type domain-containing protein n=2 Tax=Bombyx mori TaxID=7091 RepID=A0A8R2M891_BOMMO|nr:E3 SUMO-protein ligase ZBED1-like [Bombyx mori]
MSVIMGPKKKSSVWQFFNKIDDKKTKCKLCQKEIKSAGNTTNLIGHIRNVHKAAYLEIQPKQTTFNAVTTTDEISNPLDLDTKVTPYNKMDDGVLQFQPVPSCSGSQRSGAPLPKTVNETIDSDLDENVTPLKRQRTIQAAFKDISSYSESGAKTRKLNNCLLFMICKDHQSFSIVENEGFKTLMKTVAPQYKLPSRTTLRRWLDDKYEVISETIKKMLSSIEDITLTTDIWSDTLNMKSFLGITAHFGIDIELYSVTLGVYELDERHTSDYLSEILLKVCQDWKIDQENVTAVVTDNAANIVKAIELAFGRRKHIPCFAHTLNLVAEGTMICIEWRNIVSKVKSIVTWFKQSCIASDELRKATAAATESSAGAAEVKLIQSVDTRWNSTYYMLQRFLELRSVINDILFRHPRAPAMLSASEISTVSSVIMVLRPLEAATKEISGDKYCTSSKIIPLVRCMLSKITSAVIEDPVAKEVQKLAINEINKRMGSIEHVNALAIASILDPRFKRMHFNDPIACSNAVTKIKDLMKKNLHSNEEPESDSDKSDKNEEAFSLWTDHHKLVHRNWKINKSEDVLSDELSVYLRTPVGRLKENPLEIWRDYKIQFPKLYKIAFKYLTIVGTSVPSERLLSQAGLVMTEQRNRLKGKRLSKLLFLHSIDKKYWNM